MSGWQCGSCNTHNDDNQGTCLVCGGRTRSPAPAPATRPPAVVHVPVPGPAVQDGTTAEPGGGLRRTRWGLALLSTVALLLAAVLTVQVVRGGSSRAGVAPPAAPGTTAGAATADQAATGGATGTVPSTVDSSVPAGATPSVGASTGPGTAPGLVDASAIGTDPRAAGVSTTLTTYFSGINTHDYARAVSVFDPTGVLDPSNASQVGTFSHDVSTTTDSEIVVHSIADDTSASGAVSVGVTFVSHQAAGYGPKGSTGQTCTRWQISYTLTQDPSGAYRILRGPGTHASC